MYTLNVIRNSLSKLSLSRVINTSAIIRNSESDSVQLVTRGIRKDRLEEVPVETSIRYLQSEAYKQTYGDKPVWVQYRRNFIGQYPPRKTRRTCIRAGQISTGNPCPVCRDEYLVLHETNTDLLNQFICPETGSVLSYSKTGLCQKSHQKLIISIERARDRGLLTFDVPFRKYNYSEYDHTNKE